MGFCDVVSVVGFGEYMIWCSWGLVLSGEEMYMVFECEVIIKF